MYQKRPLYHLGNEAGFTLLEVIAVLVILSILAVVAVPKYFDLQGQAREKAMDMAVAEAISRVNSHFATELLAGKRPDEIIYDTATVGGDDPYPTDSTKDNMGDFRLDVLSSSESEIEIQITPLDPSFGASFTPRKEKIPNPGFIATAPTPTPTPTPTSTP